MWNHFKSVKMSRSLENFGGSFHLPRGCWLWSSRWSLWVPQPLFRTLLEPQDISRYRKKSQGCWVSQLPRHNSNITTPRCEVAALVLMPLVVQLGEEAGVERIAVLLGVCSSSVQSRIAMAAMGSSSLVRWVGSSRPLRAQLLVLCRWPAFQM